MSFFSTFRSPYKALDTLYQYRSYIKICYRKPQQTINLSESYYTFKITRKANFELILSTLEGKKLPRFVSLWTHIKSLGYFKQGWRYHHYLWTAFGGFHQKPSINHRNRCRVLYGENNNWSINQQRRLFSFTLRCTKL